MSITSLLTKWGCHKSQILSYSRKKKPGLGERKDTCTCMHVQAVSPRRARIPNGVKVGNRFVVERLLRSRAPHCVPWHRPPGQVRCSAGDARNDKNSRQPPPSSPIFELFLVGSLPLYCHYEEHFSSDVVISPQTSVAHLVEHTIASQAVSPRQARSPIGVQISLSS